MGRALAGLAAGLVAAMVTVFLVESVGHMAFPPPPGLDLANPADMGRVIDSIPFAAKVVVLIAWFLGVLAGAFLAGRIARRRWPGRVVAGAIIAAGVWTMLIIPHPWWMWLGCIALPLVALWLAERALPRATT